MACGYDSKVTELQIIYANWEPSRREKVATNNYVPLDAPIYSWFLWYPLAYIYRSS